ncbi:MAG: DUF882 domain-containing protein [Gammaproteobacteria bacterium]|nr:DUF882 domain-containing protein [Gammaproteobacteria bacterium]MCP5425693.1 DUF882 domain-containing protein [Gammaproteobacteria bacterium]MCP5459724.1 DUF882 domain-containing protein [Gammaproteobacteria bacterium]
MSKSMTTQLSENVMEEQQEASYLDRRGFLRLAAFALGGLAVSPGLARAMTFKERQLNFYAPSTGETVRAVYWAPRQGYVRDSLREISWALRDHHNDQFKLFDTHLLDQLYAIQLAMDYKGPFHIICGYRSPSTNAMLRKRSSQVAKNSYHMRAMAADIRMPGRSTADLRRAALSLQAGGVGYYPRSNFIHVDTGPLRTWS